MVAKNRIDILASAIEEYVLSDDAFREELEELTREECEGIVDVEMMMDEIEPHHFLWYQVQCSLTQRVLHRAAEKLWYPKVERPRRVTVSAYIGPIGTGIMYRVTCDEHGTFTSGMESREQAVRYGTEHKLHVHNNQEEWELVTPQ